jgi:hypothetical protein
VQISYAWKKFILRKKGLVSPNAYVRAHPEGEKQV